MINEPDWIKSAAASVVATVAAAFAYANKIERRLTQNEQKVNDAANVAQKSVENGERLIGVETRLDEFQKTAIRSLERMEDKLDRALTK